MMTAYDVMATYTDAGAETGHLTGTADSDYNLIWFVQNCLNNALRLEQYSADAERNGDRELVELFRRGIGQVRHTVDESQAGDMGVYLPCAGADVRSDSCRV